MRFLRRLCWVLARRMGGWFTLLLALSAGVWLAGLLLVAGARLGWWSIRHWRLVGMAAALAGLWQAVQVLGAWSLPLVGGPIIGLDLWALTRPGSFTRWVETPARSWARRGWVYSRRWRRVTRDTGLARRADDGRWAVPRLGRVRSTEWADLVPVQMLQAQTVTDWQQQAERLTTAFKGRHCRARAVPGRPDWVHLEVATGDPLAVPVPLPRWAGPVDLEAVPIGVREDGALLTVPVLYSHLLIGGETGSGKGSVIGSLLAALAPAIGDGVVKVLGVDPKGGMELRGWQPLLTSWSYDGPEGAVQLLEDAVANMNARARRLARRRGPDGQPVRKLTPDPAEPLIVVVIDELADLLDGEDPELNRRLGAAIRSLIRKGRAVGVSVIGATQDVRETVLKGMRALIPRRIGLRTPSAQQVDMLLGQGARERGAWCDRIPHNLPGVGYVMTDGAAEPVRWRAFHVTDADIAALAQAARAEVAA